MSSYAKIKDLGEQLNGYPVLEITLSNTKASVTLFSFGATLQSFSIALPDFAKRDVVLGYPSWQDYQKTFDSSSNAYLGAIIGPIAGRIAYARIPFQTETFHFESNEGQHLLHGGKTCFSNVNWRLLSSEEKPYPQATFLLETATTNINIPGNLRTEVTYTLKEFELSIQIKCLALEDTVSNPTQHAYFNPGGHQASILESKVLLNTSRYIELNEDKLPTGSLISIPQKDADYELYQLSDLKHYPQIDNAFVLEQAYPQAELIAQDGFCLKFSTNQPVFQVYIGGEVDFCGKEGRRYHRYSGICLEQQAEPDAPNHENFSDIYLKKGREKTNLLQINFEQEP
ncbi:MAG: Aldose 1-epimerase [Bacteroidota bacterium]